LDRNKDEALAGIELIPTALDNETSLIVRIDAAFDGTITRAELRSALLQSLDANHDGILDWKELLVSRRASN